MKLGAEKASTVFRVRRLGAGWGIGLLRHARATRLAMHSNMPTKGECLPGACPAHARRATFVLSILSLAPSLSPPQEVPQVDRTRPQTFPARHVWAEWLHHPCLLGGAQKKGDQIQKGLHHPCLLGGSLFGEGGGKNRHGWGLVKKRCPRRARRANTPPNSGRTG